MDTTPLLSWLKSGGGEEAKAKQRFDLRTLVQQHTTTTLSHVKSLQLCAYMAVRNLFTSDIKYEPRTLPAEMLPASD